MRISIGNSRKDTHWKVVDWSWAKLCKKLSETIRTPESVNDYLSMSKDERSDRKDVGGFVGGAITDGRRTKNNVASRSLITLDADFATTDSWDDATMLLDYAMCCYSTHSHLPSSPRLRFVIPLDREVTPEEYEPIARMVAYDIGIEQFDVTTYETSRLMYWPSTPKDGEFVFEKQDGDFIKADDILSRYTDWRDTHEWPISSNETTVRAKQAKSQGDPESKPGVVGLFCRTYDVPSAIDTFLPDVYAPCDIPNRYTFIQGSTVAGVVLYDNGKFAFSHHATDPAGGLLCNAFDLVRIHKFSELDADWDKDTPINKLPSYQAMCEFAKSDPLVKQTLVAEKKQEVQNAFPDDEDEPDTEWMSHLKLNKQGYIEATTENILLILENDERLKGKFAINEFTNRLCIIGNLPWRRCEDYTNGTAWSDLDDSALRHYIETVYGISSSGKVADALNVAMMNHAFHPVRDYLESLSWDGIRRAEHLFIHYMGAEDTLYTRTVTRKWLTAAVARIMNPGCKFDNMIVLVGAQGIGKSYLGKLLGKEWYSDTFTTLAGKEAYEQLKGCWILEMGELSVMKKAEVESVKMFISKQEDNYRAAYGKHAQINKRQCVFYGTTNDDTFLRDRTGNRRFWPIGVDTSKALYDVFTLSSSDIDQVWAEALSWYRQGENLYLTADVAKLAAQEQEKYMSIDPRLGVVEDYLEMKLPYNWDSLGKTERRNFIQGFLEVDPSDLTYLRQEISVVELAYELYGIEELQPYQAKDFHGILTLMPGWKKGSKRKRTYYGTQTVYERTE